MSGQKHLLSIILTLTVVAFCWGVGQAADEQPRQLPQTTIVDAAGRVHNVMPMRSITQKQRRAAAKRRKARGAHTDQHNHAVTPAPKGEVPK